MATIQVPFDIPEDIYARILTGEFNRFGGVVRDSTGIIIKHLKEAPNPVQNQESGILHIAEVLKKNKVIIAIGLGVVVAGGIAIWVAEKNRKSKQITAPEMSKCVEDYNSSLCAYLEAVRNGKLDIDTITCLMSNLDDIKENYDSGKITIDFSTEQLDTLVNLVFDYTRKLAEANSVEINELKKPVSASADNTIIDLRRYLEVQKQIFEKVA